MKLTLALFLTAVTSGCASIYVASQGGLGKPGPYAYGGVKADAYMIFASLCEGHGCLPIGALPIGIIDLPFSFVADTILLPYTLTRPGKSAAGGAYEEGRKVKKREDVDPDRYTPLDSQGPYCDEFGLQYNTTTREWEKCK